MCVLQYMFKFVDALVWVKSINSIFHKTQFMSFLVMTLHIIGRKLFSAFANVLNNQILFLDLSLNVLIN